MERSLVDEAAWCLPAHGSACFDMLPATVERLLTGNGPGPSLDLGPLAGRYERVLVVYFDAFGWRWYERHADHPLLGHARDRGQVTKLTSQFPSTTAAHMTTIHSGLPVGVHGVYEWFTLLPELNRIIAPLVFSFAGEAVPDTLLSHGVAPGDVYPEADLYARLLDAAIEVHVAFPTPIAASTPTRVLLRDAEVHPFSDTAAGVRAVVAALGETERGYGFVYLPDVDSVMHRLGPDHRDVELLIDETLSALERTLVHERVPEGTLILITSDHGMAGIDPQRTLYVNELWPGLSDHLRTGSDGKALAPAGSSRDLFLHTRPGSHDHVRTRLGELLHGRAEVHAVSGLVEQGIFGPTIGDRFHDRVGDLVALPYPGEAVYWNDPPRFTQPYYGQHGGLTHAEMEIPLIAFVT